MIQGAAALDSFYSPTDLPKAIHAGCWHCITTVFTILFITWSLVCGEPRSTLIVKAV